MKKGCIQGIFSKKHLKNDSFTPSNNKLMVTITKFITGNSFVLKPCVPKVKNCFEISNQRPFCCFYGRKEEKQTRRNRKFNIPPKVSNRHTTIQNSGPQIESTPREYIRQLGSGRTTREYIPRPVRVERIDSFTTRYDPWYWKTLKGHCYEFAPHSQSFSQSPPRNMY